MELEACGWDSTGRNDPRRGRIGMSGDLKEGEEKGEIARRRRMAGWRCFCWTRGGGGTAVPELAEPQPFSLPEALPEWPQGGDFAKGRICIGELEVVKITELQSIWSCCLQNETNKGATFYKPTGIPDGFFALGHYAQPNDQQLQGFVLVAREVGQEKVDQPALQCPVDYTLVWSSGDWKEDNYDGCGYIWLPCPPKGYKSLGFVVTNDSNKPSLDEIRCVRSDLTDTCEMHGSILNTESMSSVFPLQVWKTRPSDRGMWGKGVSVGTFFCSSSWLSEDEINIACLKNVNLSLDAMPNLEQIHTIIEHYGPTVFFHPEEVYLPSSVLWFFKNGATLYKRGETLGEPIDSKGTNLPSGGENDGEYWIDLPDDDRSDLVKHGNVEDAELYAHIKPALGGTFTDIAMWIFCPFNGPATIKIGILNYSFKKIGEHVGDWEHFTLRVSNFTGELWSIYYSQHSGGEWVDACGLEFIEGNRAVVYSSKSGHASFPHPGDYLQGSQTLGIGVRNDAAQSKFSVNSSLKYQIIAAEYLGDVVAEPPWVQYMREWGPTIVYSSTSELEKILSFLPVNFRLTVESIFDKLPMELYGEEGPTGPKEKNNWEGDERC